MTEPQIRFEDGAGYERMMGVWSRSVGQIFLDWLAPKAGLTWVDVGCGNGAITELLVERCAPAAIEGIDPSEAQLAFAHQRPAARLAKIPPGRKAWVEARRLFYRAIELDPEIREVAS